MADKKITSVYQTDNYGKFKIVDGNRPIDHAKKIIESIKDIGMLWQPVLVNERFEIIDGQGRFLAMKTLGLPIIYIMQNGLTIREVRYLNKNATVWKAKDYIHSYATGDDSRESYKNLEEIRKQFPEFDHRTILKAAAKNGLFAGKSATINAGELEHIDIEAMNRAISRLTFLRKIAKDIPYKTTPKNKLLYAVIFCMHIAEEDARFSVRQLEEAIQKNADKVVPANTLKGAIENIDYMYNYKRLAKNKYSIVRKYEDEQSAIRAANGVNGLKTIANMKGNAL